MKRILTKLDNTSERVATFLYGLVEQGERRPSLLPKLGDLSLLG
jgi:hypothetical protein